MALPKTFFKYIYLNIYLSLLLLFKYKQQKSICIFKERKKIAYLSSLSSTRPSKCQKIYTAMISGEKRIYAKKSVSFYSTSIVTYCLYI